MQAQPVLLLAALSSILTIRHKSNEISWDGIFAEHGAIVRINNDFKPSGANDPHYSEASFRVSGEKPHEKAIGREKDKAINHGHSVPSSYLTRRGFRRKNVLHLLPLYCMVSRTSNKSVV
jgi:hypothetical protein